MSDSNIIRITRHHSTKVHLRINERPEVVIPVGPIFDLDSVDQYTPDEIRETLDNSSVEYESVDSSAEAGSVGGSDALSATHPKPDPSVSATMTSGIQPESDDRKDENQMDAYGGDLEGDKSDARLDDEVRQDEESEEEEVSDERREELQAMLDDSVPNVVEKLDGLSLAELNVLYDAEKGGKTRSTLMSAIIERTELPQEDEA